MIDTYLLEQVIAFHKAGTLSAAAEELLISQPALSQSMKKLEDLVGLPLFDRQKNKTSFNENGLLLVDYAKNIMAMQEEMLAAVRLQADHKSHLYLASIAPAPISLLSPKIAEIYPHLDFSAQIFDKEEDLLEGLADDRFDLVVNFSPSQRKDILSLPYLTEKLSLLLPSQDPLARLDSLTFDDLAGQNILLLSDLGFWTDLVKSAIPQANFLYVEDNGAFESLALTGHFPTFVSDIIRPAKTSAKHKIIPIEDKRAQVSFFFLLKKKNWHKWKALIEKAK